MALEMLGGRANTGDGPSREALFGNGSLAPLSAVVAGVLASVSKNIKFICK